LHKIIEIWYIQYDLGKTNALHDRSVLEKLDREELITLLLVTVESNYILEQRIAELEGRFKENSTNSSKPPSSDGYVKPKPKSQRKKAAGSPAGSTSTRGTARPWRTR
jgi:transposase